MTLDVHLPEMIFESVTDHERVLLEIVQHLVISQKPTQNGTCSDCLNALAPTMIKLAIAILIVWMAVFGLKLIRGYLGVSTVKALAVSSAILFALSGKYETRIFSQEF